MEKNRKLIAEINLRRNFAAVWLDVSKLGRRLAMYALGKADKNLDKAIAIYREVIKNSPPDERTELENLMKGLGL